MNLINEYQQNVYEQYEKETADFYMEQYKDILSTMMTKETVFILDVGGASGYFARKIVQTFQKTQIQIVVLDNTKYSTWVEGGNVNYLQASADEINELYKNDSFDIIFANRVYHHMVQRTFTQTITGAEEITQKFYNALKPGGLLCITDNLCNGFLFDQAPCRLIFFLTTYKGRLTSLIRKLGAHSAGVGVCMRSEKLWRTLINKTNFELIRITKGTDAYFPIWQRCSLMIKDYFEDSALILKKI